MVWRRSWPSSVKLGRLKPLVLPKQDKCPVVTKTKSHCLQNCLAVLTMSHFDESKTFSLDSLTISGRGNHHAPPLSPGVAETRPAALRTAAMA